MNFIKICFIDLHILLRLDLGPLHILLSPLRIDLQLHLFHYALLHHLLVSEHLR